MEEKLRQEINRLSILNEIYKNENSQLKYEYRVLQDEFEKYKKNIKESLMKKIFRKVYAKVRNIFCK